MIDRVFGCFGGVE